MPPSHDPPQTSRPLEAVRGSKRLIASLVLCLTAAACLVQQQPYAPERGSAVRSAVMDGLRAGVRDVRGLSGPIVFRVHKLAVLGDYALTTVTPLAPSGSRIPQYEAGLECDREIVALLRRSGREWRVVERDVGPCDYVWPYLFEQNTHYPAVLLRYWENMEGSF